MAQYDFSHRLTSYSISSTPLFREDDTFDFQPQFTTATTAPEPYMPDYDLWQNNFGSAPLQMSDPNADLLATPGPDDNVGLPAADGLLLPY